MKTVLVLIFALMVFGWIFSPAHTLTEWEQFANDMLVFIVGIALLWFGLWRAQIIKDRAAEEEHKQEVANMLHARKYGEWEMYSTDDSENSREIQKNAINNMTDDQKALLRMVKNNPVYKIDTKA